MLRVYGREGCPYCDKAKNLLKLLKDQGYFRDAQYIDYPSMGWGKAELSNLVNHDVQTVPVVTINGVYIGGYTDLRNRYPID